MALTTDQLTALANERRRQDAQARLAQLRGKAAAQAEQAQALSVSNGDTLRQLQEAQTDLTALEAGLGPGLTADFGAYSSIDRLLRAERFAGKKAAVEYVKANPTCAEADALGAWKAAALAATGQPSLIQDPALLAQIYRQGLLAAGLVTGTTWESQRAWIVATDEAAIMGA